MYVHRNNENEGVHFYEMFAVGHDRKDIISYHGVLYVTTCYANVTPIAASLMYGHYVNVSNKKCITDANLYT